MKARRDVFQAIADPTRRGIIGLIAAKPQNLSTITQHFDASQQAISLHVKILVECGLIAIRQQGRERYCEARLQSLGEVSDWIAPYRAYWEDRYQALDNILADMQATPKKRGRKK